MRKRNSIIITRKGRFIPSYKIEEKKDNGTTSTYTTHFSCFAYLHAKSFININKAGGSFSLCHDERYKHPSVFTKISNYTAKKGNWKCENK